MNRSRGREMEEEEEEKEATGAVSRGGSSVFGDLRVGYDKRFFENPRWNS